MTQEAFFLTIPEVPEDAQVGGGTNDADVVPGEIPDQPAAGGSAVLYKMRGQDDGAAPPGYVTWLANEPDFLGTQVGTSVPPLVGSLIPGSVVLVSTWAF